MKETMSNIDIRLILPEIKEAAEGSFVKNVYQYGEVFVLKLYKPAGGTSQLLIQPGVRIHLTEFRRAAPRVPPKFCSVLRKYLREKRVISITQHELDRIVVLEIGDEDGSFKLVAELFGTGNLLLLDKTDTIFVAKRYRKMRDRDVVPKAAYEFPPPRGVDVLALEAGSFEQLVSDSAANVVRTLASRLNLDSLSCEEICALAGVPPKDKVSDLDGQALADLRMGLQQFVEKLTQGVSEPGVVVDDSEVEDEPGFEAFLPFPFEVYNEFHMKTFDSFSLAIDEFFGVAASEETDDGRVDVAAQERKKLQTIIDKQQESITRHETKVEKLKIEGDLIYTHFQTVQEVLETIRQARIVSGLSWAQIRSTIEEGKRNENQSALLIEKIIPSQGQIVVRLGDLEVTLDIRLSAQDNASRAYDQSKKTKSKMQGAKTQIEKTKQKLEDLPSVMIETPTKKRPVRVRKRRWYEKFRWFVSSEGYLILGGRDVRTNEQLAKRHMEANDVFLHAVLHGAPYTLIKVPDSPPGEQTIAEAAQFAVTFSRAWQDELSSGDAYWVTPEQVSFSPPSGEYLPAGAVMIYGSKNFIRRVPIDLAVGLMIENEEALPMSGPPSAIESQTDYHVRITPGQGKKGQLVKELMAHLRRLLPEELKPVADGITQEDLMRALPAGGGKIVTKTR